MLLGTAGGPLPSPVRSGIAQAVVVGGRVYLVDCGSGVTRQLRRARLLSDLHQVFVTHLHSDHDCDLFNLFLLGWPILQRNPPVVVHGPGPAGRLPDLPADAPAPIPTVNTDRPTPGLVDLVRAQIAAHAYDINVRMRDSGRDDLTGLLVPREIDLPQGIDAAPQRTRPPMSPFTVVEDDRVKVTAVLVDHPPVFPAFAFRFDTDGGAVVFSGDTRPCANLTRLAEGADILVHEVYDDTAAAGCNPGHVDDSWEARQRDRHLHTSHTGLSQVGAVAAQAGVRRLVLTHFIPGEDTLDDAHWLGGVTDFDGQVTVGRDLLELPL